MTETIIRFDPNLHGQWSWEFKEGILSLRKKWGPKSEPTTIMDLQSNSGLLSADLLLIERAPDMRNVLHTVQLWGPTLLKGLTKLEREIFMDVITNIEKLIEP